MQTASDIIQALGGPSALAGALDLPYGTVAAWKSRGSIPSRHWPDLIALGVKHGVELTFEQFFLLQANEAA